MNKPAIGEIELAPYFTTRAPFQFPPEFREGFVKYAPYVLLVLLIIAISVLLPALAFLSAVGIGGIGTLVSIASVVLRALSLPGLFNRKRQGWVYAYYGQLLALLYGVLTLATGGLLTILIGLVFLALLFQTREYYN